MRDIESAIDTMRAHGLRATEQRRAVLHSLVGDTTHPTAEQIADRIRLSGHDVSLSTVYKTLAELAEIGLLRRLEVRGSARFDPDTSAHGHLICAACGTMRDFAVPDTVVDSVRAVVEPEAVGVRQVDVQVVATCRACSVRLPAGGDGRRMHNG